MATLLWQRDIGSSLGGVKNSFSSWDACMNKAYCKWPVIVAIIIGSSIVLSLVWCCARCLCCGAQCCCGCLSCCNACCPSPRGSKKHDGYQQAPHTPYNNDYYQPPPPSYASGAAGYRSASVPQTATFDAPSKSAKLNEDSLPAMPSWDHATSRRIEHPGDDFELEKFDQGATSPERHSQMLYQNPEPDYGGSQQDSLLQKQEAGRYYDGGNTPITAASRSAGDLGMMTANTAASRSAGDLGMMTSATHNTAASRSAGELGIRTAGTQNTAASRSAGDLGMMTAAAQPYHDRQQATYTPSPYNQPTNRGPVSPSPYAQYGEATSPVYGANRGPALPAQNFQQDYTSPYARDTASPAAFSFEEPVTPYGQTNTVYGGANPEYHGALHSGSDDAYQASIAPSYHTAPPSDLALPNSSLGGAAYPGQQQYQAYGNRNGSTSGRKPVQGSWREV